MSIVNAAAGVVVSLLVLAKILVEERLLRASLPGYEQYACSTKAVIPFVL
jgi:protein-S-isoprenylcysteine O-methyltransferase Ste14